MDFPRSEMANENQDASKTELLQEMHDDGTAPLRSEVKKEKKHDPSPLYRLLEMCASQQYTSEHVDFDKLKEDYFANLSNDEFQNYKIKMSNLLKSMITSNMDFKQLDAFLTSQMMRKDTKLYEEEATVLTEFWKNRKEHIHECIVQSLTWGTTLKEINWRIDVKTHSKGGSTINTPTAILELHTENRFLDRPSVLHIEMGEQQLQDTLKVMDEIKLSMMKVMPGYVEETH